MAPAMEYVYFNSCIEKLLFNFYTEQSENISNTWSFYNKINISE